MQAVEFIIHIRRQSCMQTDVDSFYALMFELKKQFPGKGSACRGHFGGAWFLRVNRLVIIQIPRRGNIFIPYGFSQTINRIYKLCAAFGKSDSPKSWDRLVAFNHSTCQLSAEAKFQAATQATGK